MVTVVADKQIPHLAGRLEPMACVRYLDADEITPEAVADADALLVRTRTRCDSNLLAGSKVSFVGSATIGTDHIDLDWCRRHGITVANAPGCNAPAVAQWVLSTIGHHIAGTDPASITLGIIGVGHVGGIVDRWARHIGFRVLLNDPPRAEAGHLPGHVDLDRLLDQSDIITVHTPLTDSGRHPTRHLIDSRAIARAQRCRLLINAARGGIVDESALDTFGGDLAIDCWQNEPHIDHDILQRACVATPHIAGYSNEGKIRGTAMIVDALNRHFGWNAQPPATTMPAGGAQAPTLADIMHSYDPLADTARLKAHPDDFEALRNHYPLRNETT